MPEPSVFGSILRDRILVHLALSGQSHLREIARTYDLDVSLVQRTLKRLESDGLVVGIAHGRTRLIELNKRYYAFPKLSALLNEMARALPELYESPRMTRSRPRRSGKPL